MNRQLAAAHLDAEFLTAVDGRALSDADWALVNRGAAELYPKWLPPEAIGCALSHVTAWRRIAEQGDVAMVLEDDVILPKDLSELVTRVAGQMQDSEVDLLHFRSHRPCRFDQTDRIDLGDGYTLARPFDLDVLQGGAAYLVTPSAARRLLDAALPIRFTADSWGKLRDAGGFDELRCVVPSAVRVKAQFPSTIGYRKGAASGVQRLLPSHLLAARRALLLRRESRFRFSDR